MGWTETAEEVKTEKCEPTEPLTPLNFPQPSDFKNPPTSLSLLKGEPLTPGTSTPDLSSASASVGTPG